MKLELLVLFAFAVVALAATFPRSSSPSVIHERRRYAHHKLVQGQRVDGDSVVTFRIALKQKSLEHGYNYLLNVSHPSSPHYGKLWTAGQVRETFCPSEESIDHVRVWLVSSGIERVTDSRAWLSFETTIARVEELMESEYYEYEDHETGAIRIGCEK